MQRGSWAVRWGPKLTKPARKSRANIDATAVDVAGTCTDGVVAINNAGVCTMPNLVTGDLDAIRLELATHSGAHCR